MERPLLTAAFVSVHHEHLWSRQIRSSDGVVKGVKFFVDPAKADVVIVYDDMPARSLSVNADAFKVLVCSEPQNVKRYLPRFLAQFDLVLTTDHATGHPNASYTQVGLPWHVGMMSADGGYQTTPMAFADFEAHFPVKTKLVSVVCSNKAFTEEHRARLAFVKKLKEAFGDEIDVFGRGINDFADKRDVLDAYRYHIALENCSVDDYWTEKLADPFLTLTYPIYYGCPNIHDYFEADALRRIDIQEPEEAIRIIREVIDSDLAERRRNALLEARITLLNRHNIFELLASLLITEKIGKGDRAGPGQLNVIFRETHYSPIFKRILRKATRIVKRYWALARLLDRMSATGDHKVDAMHWMRHLRKAGSDDQHS